MKIEKQAILYYNWNTYLFDNIPIILQEML
jgi:hypothetical protein